MIILAEPPIYVTSHNDGAALVVWIPAGAGPTIFPAAYHAMIRALSDAGHLVANDELLMYRARDRTWTPAVHPMVAAGDLANRALLGTYDPNRGLGAFAAVPRQEDLPWADRLGGDGRLMQPGLGETFGRYLCGASHRSGVRKVAALVNHPFAGPPRADVLNLFEDSLPPACPSYSRLRALFSGLELDGPSHCALYAHLLAMVHSDSIGYERPALFVDSTARGRGKSEVGRAVAYLLDGADRSISLASTGQSLQDEVVAHLVTGARVILGQNIDDRLDFTQPFLVSLVSDGDMGSRPKYNRKSVYFRGICVILNGVYGAFSLHPDLISRTWRVELRGPARPLNPRPAYYAQEHRLEILSDCLEAHRAAQPWPNAHLSRCAVFERQGLAAYAAAFDLPVAVVAARMSAALDGAQGLSTAVVSSLIRTHRTAFESISRKLKFLEEPTVTPEGSRALGHTYTAGHWQESP